MVEIAAFMVICYLGWKFARWVWQYRASIVHCTKITGLVILLIAVVIAAAWLGKEGADILWAHLPHPSHPVDKTLLFAILGGSAITSWNAVRERR